ncbi:MAG: hypothetical protein WCD07_10845 [Burkholderiales bacterium]
MENFNVPYYLLDGFDYNLIDVQSIDETAAEVKNSGGFVVHAKHPVPGVGYMALLKYAQGILFGVWQRDATAH